MKIRTIITLIVILLPIKMNKITIIMEEIVMTFNKTVDYL